MNYYFSLISNTYMAEKNRLQTEAKDVAKQYDKRLISEEDLPEFKKEVLEHIDLTNKKHKRCVPLEFENHRGYVDNTVFVMHIPGVFTLTIYPCYEYKSAVKGRL